jgi:hypothetical protein
MADIPKEDYQSKIRDMAMKIAVSELPEPIAKIYKDKILSCYVNISCIYFPAASMNLSLPCDRENSQVVFVKVLDAIEGLVKKKEEQRLALKEVERKLEAIVSSCTSWRAVNRLLPEFEKYTQKAEAGIENLPASNDLIASIVKMGWPKGEQK